METFSALLAICAGIHRSPVNSPHKKARPVTRSFDVFFYLLLNKRLSKQSRGWRFETPSHPLWRHCNGIAWLYIVFPHACIIYISEIFIVILTHLRWHNPLVTWSDVLFNLEQSGSVSRMYRCFAPIVCRSWSRATPVFIIAILPPYLWDTGKYELHEQPYEWDNRPLLCLLPPCIKHSGNLYNLMTFSSCICMQSHIVYKVYQTRNRNVSYKRTHRHTPIRIWRLA